MTTDRSDLRDDRQELCQSRWQCAVRVSRRSASRRGQQSDATACPSQQHHRNASMGQALGSCMGFCHRCLTRPGTCTSTLSKGPRFPIVPLGNATLFEWGVIGVLAGFALGLRYKVVLLIRAVVLVMTLAMMVGI